MMTPLELYRAGELSAAIKALGDELRKNPLDAKRRTFLFELLLFAGEYSRAEKHLDVLSSDGGQSAAGALVYRSAIHAELTREEMFRDGHLPSHPEESSAMPGIANSVAFADLRDSDPRIGANLEVFIAGSYTWIPMTYIRRLKIEPPKLLRDLMWARAQIETSAAFRLQDLGEVLIPAICPLSSSHSNELVRLGRESVWEPNEVYGEIPFGPKLMLVDDEEIPLLELRSIEWTPPVEEVENASA
jgi:type VI secretion system protein ImpE